MTITAWGDGDYGEKVYVEEAGRMVTDFDAVAAGEIVPTFNGHEMDLTGTVTDYYGTEVHVANYTPAEPGVSIIKATTRDGSKSVNFAVVSEAVLAEKLSLSQKELTLSVGQTGSVEATLTPEPTLAEHAAVKWQSFDPSVAAVDYVVREGIMNGMDETHFAPGLAINRALLATILMRFDAMN